ncbi:response regulator [Flavobacterium gawalongense]|uniref:histidine kinase n=1 Tax=Flavobacterium gawalongense TaxID=2594432 RepID=A0A553BZ88_9FLAO|nr:response regulator [Flavobacterium gawalongense]TRX13545.1 response regulator [Flavobacterium gawalongense]TRX15523.1 response regulator [Flavobacterium gawalongense]TRX31362.1 response regulator [Flavobacterium gawalongense]
MKFFFNNFRYFRTQIFLSFSLMIVLIVVWFMFYLYIDRKVHHLNNFTYKSYRVSQDFSANIRNFQTFLLFGYKEKDFYINHNQKDLKLYIDNLKSQRKEVDLIFKESKELNIGTNQSMITLSKEIDNLYVIVNQFKKIALIRGFKDYGIEGKMRDKAHFLEKKSSLNKITLLQFRRHEKDYLLRSDDTYIKNFEDLYNSTIREKNIDSATRQVLIDYKNDFDSLVKLSSKLGVAQNQGLYGKINQINEVVENSFVQIIAHNKKRINELKETLFYFQLCQTLLMMLIALILSTYISKYFTKDIKLLSLDISNYIKSNFKEPISNLNHKSSIREVDFLLKSYGILKEKLSENIIFLEKKTEQANKIATFKTQFLANMSHEIRSPLNGVIGMLNMLKTSALNSEQTEYIEIAEHSADHLLGIVNMILDHSKMEAGKMKVEQYPINLKKELTKLIRLFEYRINDKNIELHFIYDDKISNNILGDNLRLQQVLINLIDNAIKFTTHGDVKLEVNLLNRIDDLQYLNFKITDSGIGIDPDKTEQMLLAFEQADLTTTRKYGGTGLGLTISNQLVQLMGGTKLNIIALESGGSSFSFEIPFKINTNVLSIEDNNETQFNTIKDVIINKALIVEDNLINQKVLYKLLDKLNIPSDIAINGKEAVSLYNENDYDIIFMDLHMPEMDGFEATEKIHSSPKYQINAIPIIAVTASAFDEDKVKAISNGMDDFITKPVVLKNLEEIIAKQMQLQM